MGKRLLIKRLVAVAMAAALCFTAMPSVEAKAAIKKSTVEIEQGDDGEGDVSLAVGKKVQLRVKKEGKTIGKTAVTYKVTAGKSVIKVSKSGVITAKKAGDAEVTIKEKNGDYSAVVYVEVTGGKKSKAKHHKIWLDRATLTLELGEGYHFSVFCRPEDKNDGGGVIWGCDDGNIIEVHDGGYIRAVGHGTTNVYATSGGCTTACRVTVN